MKGFSSNDLLGPQSPGEESARRVVPKIAEGRFRVVDGPRTEALKWADPDRRWARDDISTRTGRLTGMA